MTEEMVTMGDGFRRKDPCPSRMRTRLTLSVLSTAGLVLVLATCSSGTNEDDDSSVDSSPEHRNPSRPEGPNAGHVPASLGPSPSDAGSGAAESSLGDGASNSALRGADAGLSDAGDLAAATFGFWDPGFRRGVVRSDLGDIRTVSIGPCLYNEPCPTGILCSACPTGPTSYPQSNFFTTVQPAPTDSFWILDHNVDVGSFGGAFNNQCNSGPPDQSLPVGTALSQNRVFTFWLSGGSTGGQRANLRLATRHGPCPTTSTPYLGIGASSVKGNGTKLGRFQRLSAAHGDVGLDRSWVRFNAAIDHCTGTSPCLFYLNAQLRWGGKPRMLILTLGHLNHHGEHGVHAHWNWPIQESYFNNGYDIAYLDCEGTGLPCMTLDGSGRSYEVSLGRLVATASDLGLFDDPMPVREWLDIEGVSWSIETTGADAESGSWVEAMDVSGPIATTPSVFFGRAPGPVTTSVTVSESEPLHGLAHNIPADAGMACLEVKGRPIDAVNGDGSCRDPNNWRRMESSTVPGLWLFENNAWKLSISPVGSVFPPNTYYAFWKNARTGATTRAEFTVTADPNAPGIDVYFSRFDNGRTKSVTLDPGEPLHGTVINLRSDNAQACLEVVGRPRDQVNGEDSCDDLANWATMVASNRENEWSFRNGRWVLRIDPVSDMFPAGSYRGYWRDIETGFISGAAFTVR